MRWIETRHLEEWANRTDARARLSELLARLLRSSVSSVSALRFPSGDDAQIPGYDGVLTAFPAEGFERFVPSEDSVWEFGVNQDYLAKANDDYKSRTHPETKPKRKKKGKAVATTTSPNPAAQIDRARTTFVFVTPRRWDRSQPAINDWIREKKAEKIWREIRVIDGVGLVDWLEQSPAVAAVVAREIVGNYPHLGAYSTDEYWMEYSRQFRPALSEDVVLAGRATQSAQLLQSLSAGERLLRWKGDFLDEPVTFAVCSIRRADPQVRRHFEARTLVLETKEAARQLAGQPNLIFVTRENATDLAGFLSETNSVIVPVGRESRITSDAFVLERPTTNEMADGLIKMFPDSDMARRYARESGRSLAVLARRIPSANAKLPYWAGNLDLIPALLAGAWDSGSLRDREMLARLAGVSEYPVYESTIRAFPTKDDSPLERKGNVWAARAPVDLFVHLATHLGTEHRDILEEVAQEVFKELDPALAKSSEEGLLTSVRGAFPQYSSWLRDGLATTLLMISALGDAVDLVFDSETPQQFVNRVVSGLAGLRDDSRVIASLSAQLPLLVEAAPDPLLLALEHLLEGSGEKAKSLFQDTDSQSFLSVSSPHTGVLWALELVAWDPALLGRAVSILAALSEIDPGGRLANRPLNSLREILLPWHPQTNASMQQRIAALDHVLSNHPSVGWKLLVQLLPHGHDVGGQTPKPKYREAGASSREPVTRRLLFETYEALIPRAFSRADSAEKWAEILKIVHAFPKDLQTQTISALERWSTEIDAAEGRKLWDIIRDVVQRHSAFPNAEWSLDVGLRQRLEALMAKLRPSDAVETAKWLFTEKLPQIERMTDGDIWKRVEDIRRRAVQRILDELGVEGVFKLAEGVEAPRYVGYSLGEVLSDTHTALEIIERAFSSAPGLSSFTEWVSAPILARFGEDWKSVLRNAFESRRWTAQQLVSVTVAWPHMPSTWDFVESFGEEVRQQYWRSRPAWGLNASGEELVRAITSYIEVDRPELVIDWLSPRVKEIPSMIILEVLDALYDRLSRVPSVLTPMITWDIQQFFSALEQRDDIDLVERARREYSFLPVLRVGLHDSFPLSLDHVMAEDPTFFVQILCDVFRASSVDPDNVPPPTEQERNRASSGWRLLEGFRTIPGLEEDSLDVEKLRSWVSDVRKLAYESDRSAVAEQKIGNLLANVPKDASDGVWPLRAIRELLEEWKAPEIERGIIIGKLNMRGATSRGLYDGGKQERDLASSFRANAMQLAAWPRAQSILVKLAEIYEEDAKREDTMAEHNKLRDR